MWNSIASTRCFERAQNNPGPIFCNTSKARAKAIERGDLMTDK